LRTTLDAAAIVPEVRRRVRAVLKTVPVANMTTLADQVDASIWPERLIATLSYVYAFSAATGKPLWSAATGGYIDSSPAVVNGMLR
jgi:outer membrane protein assembly factor BamB